MTVKISGNSSASTPSFAGDDGDSGLHATADQVQLVTNGTVGVTVDSSQRVGIGTTSPGRKLVIAGDTNTVCAVQGANNGTSSIFLGDTDDESIGACTYNHVSNHLEVKVNGAERARITNAGEVLINRTTSDADVGNTCKLQVLCTAAEWATVIRNSNASPYGLRISTDTDANNTSNAFLTCNGAGNQRATIRSNGGLANYQSNNVNLCDEREKKNIEALDSTWGCLKNWELKKFHYNEDADTDDKRYGVIAQQVAEHCPEVITDWVKQTAADAVLDDDGNIVTPAVEEVTRMAVKEQQMMWMAIKALQEAQTRIEQLEAKVAALEGGN